MPYLMESKQSSSKQSSSRLLQLPRELRDHIYSFAYGPEGPKPKFFKPLIKDTWQLRERHRRYDQKHNFSPTAFPTCPLNEMLISHQFYSEATALWFRDHMFSLHSAIRTPYLPASLRTRLTRLHVTRNFEKASLGELQWLKGWPCLTDLALTVNGGVFDEWSAGKLCCMDAFEDVDLEGMTSLEFISDSTTIERATLTPGRRLNAGNEQEIQQFKDNVVALEKFIASQIADRKPTTANERSTFRRWVDIALDPREAYG